MWLLQSWQCDPVWYAPFLTDHLGHPKKRCWFGTLYSILRTCCNQMDLDLANLKAAAVLRLACFNVVVQ